VASTTQADCQTDSESQNCLALPAYTGVVHEVAQKTKPNLEVLGRDRDGAAPEVLLVGGLGALCTWSSAYPPRWVAFVAGVLRLRDLMTLFRVRLKPFYSTNETLLCE
jgi:hypothetical protein